MAMIRIKARNVPPLKAGHPWVFAQAVERIEAVARGLVAADRAAVEKLAQAPLAGLDATGQRQRPTGSRRSMARTACDILGSCSCSSDR